MASEMVERVARTLWADADDFDFDTRGPETQKRIRNRARLAIAAMREPTQAMADTVAGLTRAQAIELWRAMIDTALKD